MAIDEIQKNQLDNMCPSAISSNLGTQLYNAQTNIETNTSDISTLETNLGNRTYTEENYVTNEETITNSIDALDQNLKDVADNKQFGDVTGGNYSEFESDGTLVFKGNATVYEDLQFKISNAKVPAANAPTWATFKGNLSEFTFAVNDYVDFGAEEIPHKYLEGSNLEIHVHFATNGLDVNDRTIKWQVEYSIQNDAYANGIGVVWSDETIVSGELTIPANTPDRTGCYKSIGIIDGSILSGLKFGALIKLQLKRIASSGTEPTSDPFATQVGIHHQLDTLGSRTTIGK